MCDWYLVNSNEVNSSVIFSIDMMAIEEGESCNFDYLDFSAGLLFIHLPSSDILKNQRCDVKRNLKKMN